MCFLLDYDSCNYCCYFISVIETIMKHNYLAAIRWDRDSCAAHFSFHLHIMLMPLINCHKTDDFFLLIVPVSFVKLPDAEARTLRPYLINPHKLYLFFCVITKEMAGAAGRSLSAFVHHALSFTFFGSLQKAYCSDISRWQK